MSLRDRLRQYAIQHIYFAIIRKNINTSVNTLCDFIYKRLYIISCTREIRYNIHYNAAIVTISIFKIESTRDRSTETNIKIIFYHSLISIN